MPNQTISSTESESSSDRGTSSEDQQRPHGRLVAHPALISRTRTRTPAGPGVSGVTLIIVWKLTRKPSSRLPPEQSEPRMGDSDDSAALAKLQKKIKKLESSGSDAARLEKLTKKLKKLGADDA